ncbi:hypothetical protein MTO96_029051 [Rhipicephalus appendiculatus]
MTSASGPSVGSGASVKKKPWNRRYCCVKDCHNHEGQPGIKFYRFPGRSCQIDRRKKWIAAVRRVNEPIFSITIVVVFLGLAGGENGGKKLEAQSCCDTTDSAEESTLLHEDPVSQEGELLESLPSALDDNAEEDSTLLHEDTVSQEGELLESFPSALDDSAEEDSPLLHKDTVSQEGQLLKSLPSDLDVLCMAIDAVETMKDDKDDFVELLSLLRAALRVNVQAIHFFHVAYM